MAIIQTVGFGDFCDAFRSANRNDNFSYEGKRALFDYLEECSEQGHDMELDVIALCCDYSEDSAADIAQNYGVDVEGMDEDEIESAVEEYLSDNTSIVGRGANGSFVYAAF